jgi:hypothetical protein
MGSREPAQTLAQLPSRSWRERRKPFAHKVYPRYIAKRIIAYGFVDGLAKCFAKCFAQRFAASQP